MAAPPFSFELTATSGEGARAGVLHTRRGSVPTPAFMAVGTHAHVRHLSVDDVKSAGSPIMLGNTYHLMLRPGVEVFRPFGGIHRFMQWDRPVLTDSGGFQIFSLPQSRTIEERGALFRSFHDNSRQLLTPEKSIEVQQAINSEIMMVLDVCIDSTTDETGTREAMERTHRWALRSLAQRDAVDTGQALFGIVQGGVFPALRRESAAFLTAQPFDGFAIGGLAVGETKTELHEMTELVAALLPREKPRYLMGVGMPIDLLESVKRGVDLFDCVIPTKLAQTGYAFTWRGQRRVTRTVHAKSDAPLDPECLCPICTRYPIGYLHHLMKGDHSLGSRLISIHNLSHYQQLTERMRAAIVAGTFDALHAELAPRLSAKVQ
ncbi:MAG: tRNA guanosine(34) transglycosylase Tgt [Myxococcaceae bacterium]|nr:tRNA guanosine(34) transglycosylase Tgt [Myxococcaceae bacterium]